MKKYVLVILCIMAAMTATFAQQANCNATFTPFVINNTVAITNLSQAGIINYGDGSALVLVNVPATLGATPNHIYQQIGTYNICFQDSTQSCPPVCHTINITDTIPACLFGLGYDVQASTATFNYSSILVRDVYLNFGDGTPLVFFPNGATIQHTYSTPATYSVCILDSICPPTCINIVTYMDTIPTCNLGFTQTTQGNTTTFTNTSTSASNAILNFGDGTSAYFQNGSYVIHTYTNPATYTACMTDSLNICPMYCSNVAIQTDSTNCNLHYNYTLQNNTVSFTNTSTNGRRNIIYFGDGNVATIYPSQTITHTYANTGIYTACISDSMGLCPAYCQSFYIQNNDTCDMHFTYIVQGNQVTFTNTSTHSVGGILSGIGINTYIQAGQSITRTFSEGLHQVCLYDSTRHCPEYCDTFRIYPPVSPCGNIQAHLNITAQGLTVTANASVTGLANGTRIYTNIFDNTGNSLTSFTNVSNGLQIGYTQTYPSSGTYTICASITATATSCRDSICQTITINNQQCVADFSYIKNGNTVQLQASNATPWITDAQWSFGDGTISTDLNPTHTFSDTGYFQICLNASNVSPCPSAQQGCQDSICKYIHICTNMTATESQAKLNNQVTLFPNPSSNTAVTVRLDNITAQEVKVYNALGQTLIHKNTNNDTNILLDTSSFAAGMYSVEINTDKGKVIKKLVVQ
jgi:Secretion system C-terminal sorting domain/PKD domain